MVSDPFSLFGPGRPVQAPTGTHPPSTDEEPAGEASGGVLLLGPVIGAGLLALVRIFAGPLPGGDGRAFRLTWKPGRNRAVPRRKTAQES